MEPMNKLYNYDDIISKLESDNSTEVYKSLNQECVNILTQNKNLLYEKQNLFDEMRKRNKNIDGKTCITDIETLKELQVEISQLFIENNKCKIRRIVIIMHEKFSNNLPKIKFDRHDIDIVINEIIRSCIINEITSITIMKIIEKMIEHKLIAPLWKLKSFVLQKNTYDSYYSFGYVNETDDNIEIKVKWNEKNDTHTDPLLK